MKQIIFAVMIGALLLLGCATTTSLVSVRDKQFTGPRFTTIAVSSPYDDLEVRSRIENLFKWSFIDKRINVVRAMDIIPPLGRLTVEQAIDVLEKEGVQAVLVIAVTDYWKNYLNITLGEKTVSETASQYSYMFGGTIYGRSTTTTKHDPGHTITLTKTNVKLDTRLFVLRKDGTASMIWRANSTNFGSYFARGSRVMEDASEKVATQLVLEGFLKPKSKRTDLPYTLAVMGGENYTIALGCISCLPYAQESVENAYGQYGFDAAYTLWDPCGPFASPDSKYSACNPAAEFPPMIVNQYGLEVGKISINSHQFGSSYRQKEILKWLEDEICKECDQP